MQIFDKRLQLERKCENYSVYSQQARKKNQHFTLNLSAFLLIIVLFCYCNNRLYFLTTEKHEREKKTERRSYFLIMLRAKMRICLQVGGKFSEELEKGECCENWRKYFCNYRPIYVSPLMERFLCIKPLVSCRFVNLLAF